jgi:DNA-binding XRE family transcriptional regulator
MYTWCDRAAKETAMGQGKTKKKAPTRMKEGAEMSGSEFRAIREALGLSQEGLAEKIGLNRVTIIRHETGEYPIYRTVAVLMRLLDKYERPKARA